LKVQIYVKNIAGQSLCSTVHPPKFRKN